MTGLIHLKNQRRYIEIEENYSTIAIDTCDIHVFHFIAVQRVLRVFGAHVNFFLTTEFPMKKKRERVVKKEGEKQQAHESIVFNDIVHIAMNICSVSLRKYKITERNGMPCATTIHFPCSVKKKSRISFEVMWKKKHSNRCFSLVLDEHQLPTITDK